MVKTQLAEHDLDLKSQALQTKNSMYGSSPDQVAPETAKKTATLAEMCDAGRVINISNDDVVFAFLLL